MLQRAHIATILAAVIAASAFAATPDGSTKAKAIPLKQRDPQKAVEEEMAWMMKLYHYTPLLAMRDRMIEEVRKVKAGKKSTDKSAGWEHATQEQNGHLISVWRIDTPRAKREIYFDTGTLINTPGGSPATRVSSRSVHGTHGTDIEGAMKASNQALERTADRRVNLLFMTSTRKPEAKLALGGGRSACSR
jgi:hypothetical protein